MKQDNLNKLDGLDTINTISKISQLVNSSLKINQVLNQAMDVLITVMGAERGYIMLKEYRSNQLLFKIARHIDKETTESQDFAVSRSIINRVAVENTPIVTTNASEDPRFAGQASIMLHSIYSILCVPINFKDKFLGVIYLDSRLKTALFRESDLALLIAISNQIAIALENARLYENLEETYLESIRALANAIEAKDHYTRGHSDRVTEFALKIAKHMNLSDEQIKEVEMAGILHDVGKIGVSEAVIGKPGRLDNEERRLIEKHPIIGREIIEPMNINEEIKLSVLHHHERYDGRGYPKGLKKDEIPLYSRIIAVADSFDAMTSDRPYRKGMPSQLAVNELIKCSSSQFDPEIVEVFLDCMFSPKKTQAPPPSAPEPKAVGETAKPKLPSTANIRKLIPSQPLKNKIDEQKKEKTARIFSSIKEKMRDEISPSVLKSIPAIPLSMAPLEKLTSRPENNNQPPTKAEKIVQKIALTNQTISHPIPRLPSSVHTQKMLEKRPLFVNTSKLPDKDLPSPAPLPERRYSVSTDKLPDENRSFASKIIPPVSSANYYWEMFRKDANHSGYTYENIQLPITFAWKYKTKGHIISSPTVSSDNVFITSNDGYLYAINAYNGQLKRRQQIGSSLDCSPAVTKNSLFVGTDTGHFYCFNLHNYELRWQFKTSNWINSSPTIFPDGSKICFGAYDSYLYTLDCQTGELVWKFKTGDAILSSPAIVNDVVYVGSLDQYIYSIKDGKLIWKFKTGNWVESSPTVADGIVYVGSKDGTIYAIGTLSRKPKWTFPTGDSIWSSPAVANKKLFIGSEDKKLYALNSFTGDLLWEKETEGWIESSPAITDNFIFVGSEDTYLYCLKIETGDIVWKYKMEEKTSSSFSIANNMLYIGSNDGYLYAFKGS